MRAEIEGIGKHVCSNFGQTVRFMAMLNTRVRDYAMETGLVFPLDSLASVMRRTVDQDTTNRMHETGVDLADFRKVEEWVLKRESRLRARGGGAGAGKGPDAMVYGVAAVEAAGSALPVNAATAPESPPQDLWAGSAADPRA